MRALVAALALHCSLTAALAQSYPALSSMTCGEARALVSARGAVTLSTSRTTYEEFVRDSSYCARFGGRADPTGVATRDNPWCAIGYRCVPTYRTGNN